jgi:hypothetical protein
MATGAPGTNGVWQYGEDDSEATFSALLNKVASTTNTQIGTDRGRLTTLEARKLSGLVPIIPTGIANSAGSASYNSTTGLVTFSSTPTISLNGVFTSAYKNYRVEVNFSSTSGTGGDLGMRLRVAGVDYGSTASYYTAGEWSNSQNAGNSYYNPGATLGYLGNLFSINAAFTSAKMEFMNPQISGVTGVQTLLTGLSGSGAPAFYRSTAVNDNNVSADGFSLLAVSGTIMNGTVKVYGWN